MKSWIILIGLSVALTAAATVALTFVTPDSSGNGPAYPAPTKAVGPTPTVVIEEGLVHQFGVLPQQKTGNHSWTFKNAGDGVLELRGIGKTCSCTTATLFGTDGDKQLQIKPGESLPLEVTFMTKTWDGAYHQTVTVGTNDPKRPQIELTVEGTIRPAIVTMPADPSFTYGVVNGDKPTMRKIALYSADRPDLKLVRMTSSNPDLLALESRPITPEEATTYKLQAGYWIEVTLKPSTHLGAFAEEVLVETDHPMKADLRFKVTGKISGPIITIPERVTIRDANAINGGSEVITLVSQRPSVNFTVETKPPGIDVVVEPVPPAPGQKGSKYKMTVKVIPGTESGRIFDEIVLKTDDPKASEVKLPVDVLVQGSR